jgi:hypothetical protein
LDDTGYDSRLKWAVFLLKKKVQIGCGTVVLSPEIQRPGREGGQSSPCSTKAKNERSYASASPLHQYLRGVSRDKFTDTFVPYLRYYFHRGESTKLVALIVSENMILGFLFYFSKQTSRQPYSSVVWHYPFLLFGFHC